MNEGDLDWLVEITKEFNDKYYGVPLNVEKATHTLHGIITEPYGVAFRSEKAAIVGTIEDDPFRDSCVLQERGWYSTGFGGVKVLKHFIDYGLNDLGVNDIRMSHLASNPEVGKLLARMNFKPAEVSHSLLL